VSDEEDRDISRLKREAERLEKIRDELLEHYDSVQLFVTRYNGGDDGGTDRISIGGGNWFARYGQVRSWLLREEQETKEQKD